MTDGPSRFMARALTHECLTRSAVSSCPKKPAVAVWAHLRFRVLGTPKRTQEPQTGEAITLGTRPLRSTPGRKGAH